MHADPAECILCCIGKAAKLNCRHSVQSELSPVGAASSCADAHCWWNFPRVHQIALGVLACLNRHIALRRLKAVHLLPAAKQPRPLRPPLNPCLMPGCLQPPPCRLPVWAGVQGWRRATGGPSLASASTAERWWALTHVPELVLALCRCCQQHLSSHLSSRLAALSCGPHWRRRCRC